MGCVSFYHKHLREQTDFPQQLQTYIIWSQPHSTFAIEEAGWVMGRREPDNLPDLPSSIAEVPIQLNMEFFYE
jgi:hypothetical protein